jgi:hypothetical protein
MRADIKNVSQKEILDIKERMQITIFLKLLCYHVNDNIYIFVFFVIHSSSCASFVIISKLPNWWKIGLKVAPYSSLSMGLVKEWRDVVSLSSWNFLSRQQKFHLTAHSL